MMLDVNGCQEDYISRLQTSLVKLILNGTAKTKLAILAFLHCGEIVKNSTVQGIPTPAGDIWWPRLHTC